MILTLVPCRICNDSTRMIGTKLCDQCWELKARLEDERRVKLLKLARVEILPGDQVEELIKNPLSSMYQVLVINGVEITRCVAGSTMSKALDKASIAGLLVLDHPGPKTDSR